MSNEPEKLEPIDLMDLVGRFFKTFRRFWALMLVLALLCGGVFCLRAWRSFTPMYESVAMFSVNSGHDSTDIFNASYYDSAAAEYLAEAFPYMLGTDMMRDLMLQQLDKSYINGSITPSSVAGTNMFVLTVRSNDPQDAYDILCAAIECYPQVAVYVVDDPQVIIRQEPQMPTKPISEFSWVSPAVQGGLLGVLIGLGLLTLLTILNKTIRTTDQLKSMLNLPVLSSLPLVLVKKRRSREENFVMVASNPELQEPIRALSMKVRKQLKDSESKVVLVTSTLSGEGKTTVAVNLAQTMAADSKRVVLLDADIRSQSIAARFGCEPGKKALVDLLGSSRTSIDECLNRVGDTELYFISGFSVTERRYNIDSKSIRRILDELSSRFDCVILDTAPCGVVADTALLCHFANCVLYVVKPDYARQSQIFDTVNDLYDRKVNLAGFILNGVRPSGSRYGYGYKYGYDYGYKRYGYGYGTGKEDNKSPR